jgi:hypothetical protein
MILHFPKGDGDVNSVGDDGMNQQCDQLQSLGR